jgi:ABC-type transport system involved in multi-copper enzyme maturation permease subunit
MRQLVAAEWLKLSKRPLTRVLLTIFLALLAMQLLGQFMLVHFSDTFGFGSDPLDRQLDEWRRRTVFPGLLGAALGHVNSLGGILAVVLTAGAMGSEYGWGTLRTQLARDPDRTRYLCAKVIALVGMLFTAEILTLALAGLMGVGFGFFVHQPGTLAPLSSLTLPIAALRALFVLLPYTLLTLCFTILGRSLLAGVAGGLVYLGVEASVGAMALLKLLGGLWLALYNLTIQPSITTLTLANGHAFGLRPEVVTPALDPTLLPSLLQATCVVGLYCAGFFATALYALRRQDLTGAA